MATRHTDPLRGWWGRFPYVGGARGQLGGEGEVSEAKIELAALPTANGEMDGLAAKNGPQRPPAYGLKAKEVSYRLMCTRGTFKGTIS